MPPEEEVKQPDVQADSSAAESEPEEKEQEKPEQSVPFKRFKEVNDENRQMRQFLGWIQSQFKSPDELKELLELKRQKEARRSVDDTDEEELTETQKAQIRKLLRKSDPAYAKMAQKVEEEGDSPNGEDELAQDTEDEIKRLAKEHKLPDSEEFLLRLSRALMNEIVYDPKLNRQWRRGNFKCLDEAYERLEKDFVGNWKGSGKTDLQTKRTIAKLPTLPKGGTSVSEKSPPKGEPEGVAKATHQRAWDYLNSLRQD